jgi:5-methylcytosine-specific restriction endonuclease McrA
MPANSLDTARLLPELRQRARRITLRACPGCGRKLTPGANCPTCGPIHGYDRHHRTARAETLATEFVCFLCSKPGTPTDPLVAGHVIPRSAGGRNERRNYRAVHDSCNKRHGNRVMREAA